jgi:hypothetical protein
MRATRRRNRQGDPLASPEAVTSIFAQLGSALLEIIPKRDKDLIRMLRDARHIQRHSASDTKRGRPSHWKREGLLKVATGLNDILERETFSHISLASFVDHYLRLLDFPADVLVALSGGRSIYLKRHSLPESLLRGIAQLPAKPSARAQICSLRMKLCET